MPEFELLLVRNINHTSLTPWLLYFQLCENDVLPLKVCVDCLKKIEENFAFVSKCLEADEKLRIILDMEDRDTAFKSVPPGPLEVRSDSGNTSDSEQNVLSGIQQEPASKNSPDAESSSVPSFTLDLDASLSLKNDYGDIWRRQTNVSL